MHVRPRTALELHARVAHASLGQAPAVRSGPLRRYVFRQGVAHALAAGLREQAASRMRDFEYLVLRLESEGGEGAPGLGTDALATAPNTGGDDWSTFLLRWTAALHREANGWPAAKALVQLALEAQTSSAVHGAANQWTCDLGRPWDVLVARRKRARADVLRVFDGSHLHADDISRLWWIGGAPWTADARGGLVRWDLSRGTHTRFEARGLVRHLCLTDSFVVAWSSGAELRAWRLDGTLHRTWKLPWADDLCVVRGSLVYAADRMSGTLHAFSLHSDAEQHTEVRAFAAGTDALVVEGAEGCVAHLDGQRLALPLEELRAAWRVPGGALTLCHGRGIVQVRAAPGDPVRSDWPSVAALEEARPLDDRFALLQRSGRPWEVFDLTSNQLAGTLPELGALDPFIAAWDERHVVVHGPRDAFLREVAFHPAPGEPAGRAVSGFHNAYRVRPQLALSHEGRNLYLWRPQGDASVEVTGEHRAPLRGVLPLPGERVLTWGEDGVVGRWSAESGQPETQLLPPGLPVEGAGVVGGLWIVAWRRFLPWRFQLWALDSGEPCGTVETFPRLHLRDARGAGVESLSRGPLVLRADGGQLHLSTGNTQRGVAPTPEGLQALMDVVPAPTRPDGADLPWCGDGEVRCWTVTPGGTRVLEHGTDGEVVFALGRPARTSP